MLVWGGALTGVRSARRVLANIVTYMIFDDHEVTDDWFRTTNWTENALKHRAAERVMSNGLVAYWAFQGWGNDPDAFDEDFRNLMSAYTESGGRHQAEVWSRLARSSWSYVAPTSPPVLVLDTRTRRETSDPYEDAVDFRVSPDPATGLGLGVDSYVVYLRRNVEAPRLLNAEERARIRQLLADQPASRNGPLVVISPAPIFGFPPLEEVQAIAGRHPAPIPDVADLESWNANPRNLIDVMELFASHDPDLLLILSGDVHYGFEVLGRIHKKEISVPFVQLCSSAFKNKAVDKEAKRLRLVSRFSNKDRSIAYWDLRKAGHDDGPMALIEADRASANSFADRFGLPKMIVETQFVRRPGRLDVHGRIEMGNNLGDLVIHGDGVSHRHWIAAEGSSLVARDWSDWRISDWPVPSPLASLIDAVIGGN